MFGDEEYEREKEEEKRKEEEGGGRRRKEEEGEKEKEVKRKKELTACTGSIDKSCTDFPLTDSRLDRHEYLIESEWFQVFNRVAIHARFGMFHRRQSTC